MTEPTKPKTNDEIINTSDWCGSTIVIKYSKGLLTLQISHLDNLLNEARKDQLQHDIGKLEALKPILKAEDKELYMSYISWGEVIMRAISALKEVD